MRPLAVPQELRDHVQDQTVPEETARLHLATASGAVRSFCQWSLSAETVVERRIRPARTLGSLWLPTLWLRAVTAVVTPSGASLPANEYDWVEHGQVMLTRTIFVRGPYRVSYEHGYLDSSAEMDSIKGVVLGAAARLLDNPFSLRSWATGSESATMAGGNSDVVGVLSREDRKQLEPYVLVWLG